ncbi:MAG: NAD(P)-dependent glycerol-3-phosphate dehydrogenase, partial [Kiritimatiellae bacterium]|nr:NAD(P)-dependent glycerol-3-phosphate dehydrogenase [Kiritimatiellia bacterium]
MKIAVIGDGGWGTANALLLAGYGHDVTVWGAFPDYIEEQKSTRRNERFLKGIVLPDSLKLTADCREAVEGADIVVLAPPSKYFAAVLERFKGLVKPDQLVVSLTKGLCESTNRRMTDIAGEILGVDGVVALAGPTHAEEVARGIPTAIVAASTDVEKAKKVQEIWSGPAFRVYTSSDPVGVEIGGAVKNVIAIAVGCSDGMGFGDNTRSALITRALVEMKRFVLAYGGTPETLSGLAGIGDLIVTCTSVHSRNHSVGERLGRGEKIDEILGSMQMVAEGVWNSKVVHSLAEKLGVDMPICNLVYALCYEGFDAREAVTMMMTRELKSE